MTAFLAPRRCDRIRFLNNVGLRSRAPKNVLISRDDRPSSQSGRLPTIPVRRMTTGEWERYDGRAGISHDNNRTAGPWRSTTKRGRAKPRPFMPWPDALTPTRYAKERYHLAQAEFTGEYHDVARLKLLRLRMSRGPCQPS